jgi:hypothetical protein
MKHKLLESTYDKETCTATATISCKYGVFTAKAKAAEEDKEYASWMLGPELAERKAVIKALKEKERQLVAIRDEDVHIYKMFEDSNYTKVPRVVVARTNESISNVAKVRKEIALAELAIKKGAETNIEVRKLGYSKQIERLKEINKKNKEALSKQAEQLLDESDKTN